MDLSNENVVHIKKEGIEYLQFKKLLEYKDIINHAYGIGIGKNYRTTDKQNYQRAMKDYENLCYNIGSKKEHIIKPNQKHTDEVKIVKNINLKQYEATDGLITNKENIMLSTTNADCILLLFFDPIKKVIANIHSGWRGTLQRISVKTVKKMKSEYQSNPEDIICCICPSIRKCHFEVEKEVKENFEKEFQDIQKLDEIIIQTVPDLKWNIDTVRINQMILQKEGLKKENIIDSKICSVCNKDIIHSFRSEGIGYGLSTAVIELKNRA